MPWAGPTESAPFPSLGWQVAAWIESHCVIPDQDRKGEPYLLTPEMIRFLVSYYRIRPNARADGQEWKNAFSFTKAMLVRPQKWGKGPLTAAMTCAEARGPVVFAGWDAAGQPVGRPWTTPKIQITATSEDQTANVFKQLLPMIQEGPLADEIPDTGQTRINLPGGDGFIEPVTASANSRLGQPITFAVQDETQLWVKSNSGWKLGDNQERGLTGMGGRSVQTTNCWDPADESFAQLTYESGDPNLLVDYNKPPSNLRYTRKEDREKIHKHVYGDSWWVNLDRIERDAQARIKKDPGQAERFYGNRIIYGRGRWIPEQTWESAERDVDIPEDGEQICLGFDGSESNDWSALIGITMDGTVFVPTYGPDFLPCVWNPEDFDGHIPRGEVHAAVDELMSRYRVVRFYCDPFDWRSEIAEWANRYPQSLTAEWATNSDRKIHPQLMQFETDISTGVVGYIRSKLLSTHVANARRVARTGQRYTIGKASERQKIDAAMSMILSHAARHDAIQAGWRPRNGKAVPNGGRMVVKRR
ncbi:hypothetical protein [Corynebacterium flavescens]|uniref:hypothetical protein n=1 Tax=Corynebacterium flavescens TaxID=28028 RepID=UPI003FD25B1B